MRPLGGRLAPALVLLALLAGCGGGGGAGDAPAPAAARAEWYVLGNGQRRGPLTEEQLRAEIVGGRVGPADEVWRDGMATWASVASVLGSILGTGATDPAGAAFLALCRRAAEVPGRDMNVVEMYAADAEPRPSESAARRAVERHAALLEDARNGLRTVGHVELDYSAGAMMMLPHLAPARTLAKLLRADAILASSPERRAADAAAIARLARQVAQDRTLISSRVAMANAQIFADVASSLPAEAYRRDDLREVIEWLRGSDPFNVGGALATERDFMIDDAVGEIRAGRTVEYGKIANLDGAAQAALQRAADDLDSEATRCRAAYDELITIVTRSRDPSGAALAAFDDRVRSGAYGDLATALLSHADAILDAERRTFDRLAPILDR